MSENDLEAQLRRVIAEAVRAMPDASVSVLTRWIREHHGALTEPFHERWINAGLASLCRTEIGLQRPMKRGRPGLGHTKQYRLPFPGFEEIPYRMELPHAKGKPRRDVALPNASLENLKERRMLIQGKFSAELPQLNKLIALMEPYDKTTPGIRVAEMFKLRAASRRAPGRTG